MSGFVGKYVYYGDKEGGFCFGRIVAEAKVNTADGIKEVFILEDRMSCQAGGKMNVIRGRTTLRKDRIDLEKDVYERKMSIGVLTDEQLFLCMMAGDVDKDVVRDAIGRGVAAMLYREKGEEGLVEGCKREMESRMGRGVS